MSVIFGYISESKNIVYLVADNRATDIDGKLVSDDTIKIEVVNSNTAVAFAGNCGAQAFFLKCYKEMEGYKNWLVNELAGNICAMCNSLRIMETDWAKQIANSNSSFLVAGKSKDNMIKLFAITFKNYKIDCKEVPMMLFHPNDCDFQKCGNILVKNINLHPKDFASRTLSEISKISKLISRTGDMWVFDLEKDESTFIKI